MKKEWVSPFWENAAKDRLTVRLNITNDDGSFSTSVASVSKFDVEGNISPDYEEIIAQNSLDQINQNTTERLERHKKRREAEIKREQERAEAKRLEDLFNQKLAAFEIEAIKTSTNRQLKAKIRRSRNIVELMAYATILISEGLDNESGATQEQTNSN